MKRPAMAATGLECPYEASDEASESELLDRSLSVWRGRLSLDGTEEFAPIPLDLHTACSIGQYDCVRNIIQRGDLDLNAKNRGGWTALMYACYIGHDNVVNLLLDARVHVNVKNNKGQTPLMLAASCGNESVAYFLLQQGAELEARDKKGWSALFHATYSGHQNMVKFLLENNADMEAKEPTESFTPFMVAAAEGHEIIVQYFLQHGVNVNAKGRNGDMARTLALMNGYTKIVSLIDNHSLDVPPAPRADPGLRLQDDLSSSDEAVSRPRRHTNTKPTRRVSKGPSIRDGPEAFAKLVNMDVEVAQPVTSPNSCVPKGYVTFKSDNVTPPEAGHIRSRDVTSPIDPEDHTGSLDSSGGREFNEYDDDTNAFSKTGALTIKSSSSSSGGLVAAFGISRPGSTDEDGLDAGSSSSAVQSDPGQRSKVNQVKDPGQGHTSPELKVKKKSSSQTTTVKTTVLGERKEPRPPPAVTAPAHKSETPTARVPPFPPHTVAPTTPRHVPPPAGPRPGMVGQLTALPGLGVAGEKGRTVTAPESGGLTSTTNSRPHDLHSLLKELGLAKYLVVFEEQDVDLQVFLSLTDNDLKEVGIKLFGPRRKMTNAIARWHSNAPSSGQSLEQAYADKLEAEMQELAIQLHQAYEQVEQFKAQVLQERELRSVTEGCLMEDRSSWQHIHHLATDTLQRCTETEEDVKRARHYVEELSRRRLVEEPGSSRPEVTSSDSLVKALHQGLSLGGGDAAKTTSGKTDADGTDLCRLPATSLLQRLQVIHDDIRRSVTMATMSVEKLLGRNAGYGGVREGFS